MAPSFSETQLRVFNDRYALRNPKNPEEIVENSPEQMWRRVAKWGASLEEDKTWEGVFYEALEDFKFIPGGRILHAAGSGAEVSAHNCFVIPSPEDSREGILASLGEWVETQARGGGVGINMSSLRPKGALVRGVHGTSSGPVPWMELFSTSTLKVVQQGGSRRGAAMIMLNDDHPDIFEFITAKKTPGCLEGANLTVVLSEAFMLAVRDRGTWDLKWKGETLKTVEALELWDAIIESAWSSGEPGLFWMERANLGRNLWYLPEMEFICSNPCLLGDTRMLTNRGFSRIDSVGNHTFWTPLGWTRGTAWKTGRKRVVNVVLSNGQRITTTPDHTFAVGESWEEAESLQGQSVEPFVGDGTWSGDDSFSPDDLLRLGFLQGDGQFQRGGGAYVNLGVDDGDIEPLFPYKTHGRKRARYIGVRDHLLTEADRLGMERKPLPERGTPEGVWALSPESLRLFLKGLYSANGSVLRSAKRVTLKSTCLSLLVDVQRLLLALGFRPYITTNHPSEIEWPNGTYVSRRSYDLNIVGGEVAEFGRTVGFVQEYKMSRLAEIGKVVSGRRIIPTVVAVEDVGEAEVYDFSAGNAQSGWANGFLVHNCAEIPLPAYGACNLGTINVHAFIKDGGIDWDHMAETVEVATRFLDNVIDLSYYPLPQFEQHQKSVRQMGLGATGIADALIELQMPYGSPQSRAAIEDIYRRNLDCLYRSSIQLARERGAFPLCDKERHAEASIVSRLPDDISDGIKTFGIRNSYLAAQQPSGTQSLLAGVNSGIEPVFGFNAVRKDRTGEYVPTSHATRRYQDVLKVASAAQRTDNPKMPNYFVQADQVTPEEHVLVQAAAQRWLDQSVSKTVNGPNSHTFRDVSKLYKFAYDQDLRTIAYYRDGSRDEQVLNHQTVKAAVTEAPTPVRVKLPVTRGSLTHRFQVGEQEGYVTVGLYPDGSPGEIFVTMSKEGSTIRGLMDAFATSISVNLQHGVPVDYLVGKFSGSNFEPAGMTSNDDVPMASSVLDYIFRWLGHTYANGNGASNGSSGHTCPECGVLLTTGEGCEHCEACGYSKCG